MCSTHTEKEREGVSKKALDTHAFPDDFIDLPTRTGDQGLYRYESHRGVLGLNGSIYVVASSKKYTCIISKVN